MDKEEEREPYSADLSMPRVGDDPLARGARRRRGGRMIDRRERPSSIVRPEPNFSKMESARAANRRRQRVALLTDRASIDKDERERGSVCDYLNC
jgi:hypothetical protein